MASVGNLLSVLWTVVCLLAISTVNSAFWPALPSDMGAAAGISRETASQAESRHQRRLGRRNNLGGGSSSTGTCTCINEFEAVEKRSRENEANLQELKKEMDGVYGAMSSLKKSLGGKMSGSVSAAQAINIAFSARVGYNRPYLGETEVIVFDELVINNGDVYDPYSGKFTSPVPGLYHFETTILSGFNATIETMLVMNGNEICRVFSGGFNTRGSGTNSVLLNMKPGDEIWVSVFFGNGDYVHGLWSTFSGYLVSGQPRTSLI